MKLEEITITVDLTAWNASLVKAVLAVNGMHERIRSLMTSLNKFSDAMEKMDKELKDLEAKRAYRARFGPDVRDVYQALLEEMGWVDEFKKENT
jgi:hypothetical protein